MQDRRVGMEKRHSPQSASGILQLQIVWCLDDLRDSQSERKRARKRTRERKRERARERERNGERQNAREREKARERERATTREREREMKREIYQPAGQSFRRGAERPASVDPTHLLGCFREAFIDTTGHSAPPRPPQRLFERSSPRIQAPI